MEASDMKRLLPDWTRRRRSEALKSDIVALDVAYRPLPAPAFGSDASLLGAAYTLEGSRMGADVVLRRVGRHPSTSYLRHGRGERFWSSFVAILESSPVFQNDPNEAVSGARKAFELFLHGAALCTT